MEKLKDNETYLLQQDETDSNLWNCSKCKFEFWWGENGDDIINSELKYCPSCGRKIKEFVFIEEDEGE